MVYEFVNIWPTSLTEIALSYDTASDIEQFDCSWAYQYFKTPENDQGSVVTQNPTQD